jgi:hypothetical protein
MTAMLVAALTSAVVLVFAASASALAAGPQINVGTPLDSGPPSVAIDSKGTAYIAWANTKDLPPVTTDIVQYCVLPANATACAQTGSLTPADSASHIDGVQVVVDGSTVVVLADVFGASGAGGVDPGSYEPEQEWQSADGGATFVQQAGGKSIANGILNADTGPLSAVILPGTGELGFGWETAGGSPPTFNAFPLENPPVCSESSMTPCATPFASLSPNTNPDQLGNGGGQYASQTGTGAGVMGIFSTDFTNGPLGCSGVKTVPFGTAFAYGSGVQSPTNDYNISPGSPNSAWRVAATQADCNVESPAVGGGVSGFGVVEDNDLTGTTIYHRFDAATQSFDTTPVTIAKEGEQQPAVSQDSLGGVYVTYRAGAGGPIRLAYSSDGGTTWTGPATLNANATDQGDNNVTSSVDPSGQGWAAWVDNGSVFAQQFNAADAIPPPAADTITTAQKSGTATGTLLNIPAGTVGETDTATIAGDAASTATGTMTYTLYSKSSCVASSAVFHGASHTVAGAVAPASAGVTSGLALGKYYWQAAYSGDLSTLFGHVGNVANVSTCGSEVLTVGSATTSGASATANSKTVTVTVSCAVTPCTVTITITIDPPANTSRVSLKKKKKPKIITIASGKFKLSKKGNRKLDVKLSKAGKKLLKADHGHLKALMLVSDKTKGGLEKSTRTIKITTPKPKHKQK